MKKIPALQPTEAELKERGDFFQARYFEYMYGMKKCTACDGKGFIKSDHGALLDCNDCQYGWRVATSERQGPAPDSGGDVGQ